MNYSYVVGSLGMIAFLGTLYLMAPQISFSEPFSTKPVFTLFYVPWCPYCKKMKGEWDAFSKQYKHNSKVKIQEIDMERKENKPLRERYGIKSYPTMILEKDGKMIKYPQSGERKKTAFASWLHKHL